MRKIFFILFLCFCSPARAQNTFEKVIDTLGCVIATGIQETFDGGYVFCGMSSFNGNDAMVVKLDSIGTIEWAKIYSGPGIEAATSIEQTPDSGFIVNAVYNSGLNSKNWLLKLDENGDTLWTSLYTVGPGATNVSQGNSMASINNAIYGFTGSYNPQSLAPVSAYFISYLSNGIPLTHKIYNTSSFGTQANSIDKTFDGGFIIAASIGTSPSSVDFYLIRTNAYGDTIWTKTHNNSHDEGSFSVQQSSDSGFIVAGYTWNSIANVSSAYLLKTDSIGDSIWSGLYGATFSSGLYSVCPTSDGGYIATGRIVNGTPLTSDVYLLKVDAMGNTLWSKQFGDGADDGYYVRQTKDEGYIICGKGSSPNSIKNGTYIIKTDSLGNVSTGTSIEEYNIQESFSVYPNPSDGSITIHIDRFLDESAYVEIYSTNNECVYNSMLKDNTEKKILIHK
ncbi:MAG: hypothetical protein IPK10_06665 [Bacteroidetes bacterium]|nr:hypothetical protein [Bacteroidota bacterium]